MSRTLIGYGYTNSQGIAVLDHNTSDESISGYTGTGAGKLKIIAVNGDVESTVYEFLDAKHYDKGLSGEGNYTNLFSNMDWFTRGSDGTTVTYTNSGSAVGRLLSNRVSLDSEFAVELNLVECTKAMFRIDRYGTGTSTDYHANTYTGTGKVYIEVQSDKTIFYLDNVEVYRADANSSEEFNFEIRCPANDSISFKYTDLVIYPI